jgi:hypothetical protein
MAADLDQAQLRFVDRRFVYEEFNLFSALPDFKGRFEVQKQQALFFEPGLAYEFSQTEELRRWKPLFSLYLSQAGWIKTDGEAGIPVDPLLDAGFGISPPVELGEWEIGFNYRWTPQTSLERRLRLGSVYRLGILEFSGGLDEQNWSLGAMAQLWNFSAGLLHKRSEISRAGVDQIYDQSTYLEFRLTL